MKSKPKWPRKMRFYERFGFGFIDDGKPMRKMQFNATMTSPVFAKELARRWNLVAEMERNSGTVKSWECPACGWVNEESTSKCSKCRRNPWL